MSVNYSQCPHCERWLPAHQGHKKTFKSLTSVEKGRSIRAMTINLRKAIKSYSRSEGVSYEAQLLKVIKTLVKNT